MSNNPLYAGYVNSKAFAGRGSVLAVGSGASSPYTFTALAEVKKIAFSGSKYDLADVTNMESTPFREWLPTLADSGEVSFECNYIPGDVTQAELINLFNNATLAPWQVQLPNGSDGQPLGVFAFNAYVQSIDRDIPLDKEAVLTAKLKITGKVTFWADSGLIE